MYIEIYVILNSRPPVAHPVTIICLMLRHSAIIINIKIIVLFVHDHVNIYVARYVRYSSLLLFK